MAAIAVYNPPGQSIEKLKQLAIAEAKAAEQSGTKQVIHAWQCGKHLCDIKDDVGHGNFGNWLKENWEKERQTAYNYMSIANALNFQRIGNLTSIAEALRVAKEEAKPKVRHRVIEFVEANQPCTDEEIALGIEENASSVRGRRNELCKDGFLRKCGDVKVGKKKRSTFEIIPLEERLSAQEQKEEEPVVSLADALRAASRCKSIDADYLANKTGLPKSEMQAWLKHSEACFPYKAVQLEDKTFQIVKSKIKSDKQFIKDVKSQSLHGVATPVESLSSDLAALSHKVEGILSLYSQGCKDFSVWSRLESDDRKNLRFLLSSAMAKVEKHFPLFLELIEE